MFVDVLLTFEYKVKSKFMAASPGHFEHSTHHTIVLIHTFPWQIAFAEWSSAETFIPGGICSLPWEDLFGESPFMI